MGRDRSECGTTLVEAVVAIGLLAGAVVLLAGLSHVAVRSATLARERSLACIWAIQKMEDLCRDVRSLSTSPSDAPDSDSPGFVEYLDARGHVTAGDGAMFVRRWSVTAMTPAADLLAIQVDAAVCRGEPGSGRCADVATHVRFAGVRSRLAW
jgi:hypothetical protein